MKGKNVEATEAVSDLQPQRAALVEQSRKLGTMFSPSVACCSPCDVC